MRFDIFSKIDDILHIDPTPPENYESQPEKKREDPPLDYYKKQMGYKYKKSGHDERYEILYEEPDGQELLYNLSQNIRKLNLWTLLQEKGISLQDKISWIENYEKTAGESPLPPNIRAGGLFEDWEREV
jgi:hypothetical protein